MGLERSFFAQFAQMEKCQPHRYRGGLLWCQCPIFRTVGGLRCLLRRGYAVLVPYIFHLSNQSREIHLSRSKCSTYPERAQIYDRLYRITQKPRTVEEIAAELSCPLSHPSVFHIVRPPPTNAEYSTSNKSTLCHDERLSFRRRQTPPTYRFVRCRQRPNLHQAYQFAHNGIEPLKSHLDVGK